MSQQFQQLSEKHIEFIRRQAMYFVGTAASEGSVNVSPKGLDSLRVIDVSTVVWLNLTGSGNESAAHVLENPRMTLMFCSFDQQPQILRLYGQATTIHERDALWQEFYPLFPDHTGARQLFKLEIDLVQTSCGFAVPMYELKGQRPTLSKWGENRGREGVREYWRENNQLSLDGNPTGIVES